MNITLLPSVPNGRVTAISSKSAAHRALICAAFAKGDTVIRCERTNDDIDATADCLRALGAKIEYTYPSFSVTPINSSVSGCELNCRESGSTLRFLLPIIPALGVDAHFLMSGRLPARPLSPLYEELVRHGAVLSEQGTNPLVCGGALSDGAYRIRGDVSSQFISGLLFALAVSHRGGTVEIEGKFESQPYVDMTLDALRAFGVDVHSSNGIYTVPKDAVLCSPGELVIEGDWSGAAFPLCMGALSEKSVTVSGLSRESSQGDKAITDILSRFGADIRYADGEYTVLGGAELIGTDVDASQIPDLVPVISVVAAAAKGKTRIYGAARLRLKESDRLASVCAMLTALGADVRQTEDGLMINGGKRLRGGAVDSAGDHRIAMSTAVASVFCDGECTVMGAQCVSKSYPDFWQTVTQQLGIIKKD